MSGEQAELSINQNRAIIALMSCRSIKDASDEVEVAVTTMYKYLANPVFVKALRKAQDAVLQGVVVTLVNLAQESTEVLQDIMWDEEVSAAVRARVASNLLTHAHKYVELTDLANRIAAIEKALGQ